MLLRTNPKHQYFLCGVKGHARMLLYMTCISRTVGLAEASSSTLRHEISMLSYATWICRASLSGSVLPIGNDVAATAHPEND